MRRWGVAAFVLVAHGPLAALGACSQSAQPPLIGDKPPSTLNGHDGSADASVADVLSDAGPCSPLSLNSGLLTEDFVAQDLPPPQGGTLVDGTYTLVAAHDYTGPGGQSGPSSTQLQQTVLVAGSSLKSTVVIGTTETTQAYAFALMTPDGGVPNSMLDLTLVWSTNAGAVTRSTMGFTAVGKNLTLSAGGTTGVENVLARP